MASAPSARSTPSTSTSSAAAVAPSLNSSNVPMAPTWSASSSSTMPGANTDPEEMEDTGQLPALEGASKASSEPQATRSSALATSRMQTLPAEELLASVVEMRLDPSKPASGSPAVDTLDLSNRKLGDVPEELAEIIRDDVVRLALAYNLIHTLPRSFAGLHRLRYLNIRSNLISTFPMMLCEMPRLEILDISRNKLRKLPSEPGKLLNLRVLSIRQNRLRRLPLWVTSMQHIRVLQIEENPLQWPPPHVSIAPVSSSPPHSSAGPHATATTEQHRNFGERQHRVWIATLKRWMSDNAASERERERTEATSGHERGKLSTASLYGMSGPWQATVETSPLSSAAQADGRGPSLTNGHMLTAAQGESADSSLVNMTNVSSTRSSPERSFKIRPLVLTRVASISASNASMSRDCDSSNMSQSGRRSTSGSHEDSVDAGTTTAKCPRALPASKGSDGSDSILSPATPEDLPSSLTWVPTATAAPASVSDQTIPLSAVQSNRGARASTPPLAACSGAEAKLSPKLTIPKLQPAFDAAAAHIDRPFKKSRPAPQPPAFTSHARNNSHTLASPSAAAPSMSAKKKLMKSKKSLPDLRAANAMPALPVDPVTDTKSASRESLRRRSRSISGGPGPRPTLQNAATTESMPVKASLLPVMESDFTSSCKYSASEAGMTASTSKSPLHRKPSARRVALLEAAGVAPVAGSSNADSEHQQLQRDSYFKRLSTFPPSIYAATTAALSPGVLKTVDATRGILFALSQIYTALKQYTLFATDERISAQFSRVLDVAGSTLAALIDALDRFDSQSIRGQISDAAVQPVLGASRASVDTFRKVVSVLKLQLKPLQSGADVRYTRSLLLMLYGATTEVSNSWREILEAKRGTTRPAIAPVDVAAAAAVGGGGGGPPLPAIAESASPEATSTSPTPTARHLAQARPQRKRHAGSFSAQDVREGAMILPAPPATAPSGGATGATPMLSTPSRRSARRVAIYSDGLVDSGDIPSTFIQYNQPTSSRSFTDGLQWGTAQRRVPISAPPNGHQQLSSVGSTGSATGKAIVDQHLLALVQSVTSTASGIWITLLEHLAANTNGILSPEATPTLTPTRPSAYKSSSNRSESPAPSATTSTGLANGGGAAGGNRKLLELRSHCLSAAELTRRLQHTLEKVQDEMDFSHEVAASGRAASSPGGPLPQTQSIRVLVVDSGGEARRLLDESVAFARTVTALLLQIRSLSITHNEALSAPDLKRNLAALTHGCANLLVHLHFCAPDGGAASNRSRAFTAGQQPIQQHLQQQQQQQQQQAAAMSSQVRALLAQPTPQRHQGYQAVDSPPTTGSMLSAYQTGSTSMDALPSMLPISPPVVAGGQIGRHPS